MKRIKFLVVILLITFLLVSSVITSYANVLLLGDTNLNSKLDINDATLIQLGLANISTLSEQQLFVADADDDGYIAITDATIVQKCLAKMITPKYRDLDDEGALDLPFVPIN